MAVTELTLLFLGGLATLGTVALFQNYADPWTELVVTFGTAILWGIVGMSANDVIVRQTSFATASEPITPLVYVGFGFAAVIFLYGFHDLLLAFRGELQDADIEDMMG